MPRSKTSPHYSYSQPLLQAMVALTGGKPNVKVRNMDAAAKACEIMGITLDAHGKQEQTGQWWTVRWATLAMLDHKTTGLMDFPIKGWWVLTPAGAKSSGGAPLVDAPNVIAEAEAVVAKPVAPVAPAPVAPEPLVAELLANIPDTIEQVVDSYLLSLQMASTPCFSNWSAKSDSCKGCALAAHCYEGMLTKLASLADDLPLYAVDATPAPAPQASAPVTFDPSNGTTAPTTARAPKAKLSAATAGLDPSVFAAPVQQAAAVAPLDTDNTPPTKVYKHIEMALIADANCVVCKQLIREGEMGAYSRKMGFAHIACARKAAGVTP